MQIQQFESNLPPMNLLGDMWWRLARPGTSDIKNFSQTLKIRETFIDCHMNLSMNTFLENINNYYQYLIILF